MNGQHHRQYLILISQIVAVALIYKVNKASVNSRAHLYYSKPRYQFTNILAAAPSSMSISSFFQVLTS
jgi:hypothetical protein